MLQSKKRADEKKNRDPTGKSRPRIGTLDDPSVLVCFHIRFKVAKNQLLRVFDSVSFCYNYNPQLVPYPCYHSTAVSSTRKFILEKVTLSNSELH